MAEPFLSELRIMSFNFAPKGWAFCNGQLLPINQNQALFSLLGTTYGGDGRVTFGLPDLRGRCPIHLGSGFTPGQRGGETSHTLIISEMPSHIHPLKALNATAADAPTPQPPTTSSVTAQAFAATNTGNVPVSIYGTGTPNITLGAATLGITGNSQPHNNQQPFLVLNLCIALQGIFPSQT
jgi:microcystin-dependent protein